MGNAGNIVFIGMPGAGKSTVGVVVAKMLGLDFLDADLLIQKREGATLQQIINAQGTDGFLEVENQVLQSIECTDTLVSTGGSAVYSDDAMSHLSSLGTIVYLQVSLGELETRLGSLVERGVVMQGHCSTLAELYAERCPLYEHWADLTICTDGMGVRQVAEAVHDALAQGRSS